MAIVAGLKKLYQNQGSDKKQKTNIQSNSWKSQQIVLKTRISIKNHQKTILIKQLYANLHNFNQAFFVCRL
jgi:hypothetical protein